MKSATLTSKIIRILIKSSLLPITLNLEKNVFKFDFWSKPTMIHLLFHCSPNILAFILYWYAGYNSGTLQNFLENSSFAEKFSSFGVCLIYIKIHLILPVANQLNSMPSHLLIAEQMRFPKYGIWNILGFIMMFLGSVLFNTGVIREHSEEENLTNYLLNVFFTLSQSFYWCISSIVIQVWFETIANDKRQDIIEESKIFVRNFRQFTAALGNYFFSYFAMFQIVSIATLFLTCSKLILQVSYVLN